MIDVNQQLIDLFNKEEMLAFFDFQLRLGGNKPESGLCKISTPKGTEQHAQYISLLFLIDTPAPAAWEQVHAYAESIKWDNLKSELPGIETILSIPHQHHGIGIYFKETAVYLARDVVVSKYFVSSKLYPAVVKVMGLHAGEMVYWEDSPERNQKTTSVVPGTEPTSLLMRLKEFLGL